MRVLLVKLSSIGDIVHALPALAAARRLVPGLHISWVVDRRYAEILRGNPLLDELIELDTRGLGDRSVRELISAIRSQAGGLRRGGFDVAIDLQGLIKSAAVARISGARRRWGFSRRTLREPAARVFFNSTVDIPDRTHVVRKNLMLAGAALGFDPVVGRPEFPIATTEAHRSEAAALLTRVGGRYAVLNPAGGWVTKLWHAEKFGELADRIWDELGIVSLVSVGPGEDALADRLLAASKSGRAIAVRPSLKGFYELARHAAVYVGGDTGPTHLAVASGAPVVGIFGPTEWWRNGSLDPDDICIERTDIGCRIDCHRRTCDNWICMDIPTETVLTAVKQRLVGHGGNIRSEK